MKGEGVLQVGRLERAAMGVSLMALLVLLGLLGAHLLRINHVETPLDALFEPPPVVGQGEVVLLDGAVLKIQTGGYDGLTAEQLEAATKVKLRVRATRPEVQGGQTQLWINAVDERGRIYPHFDKADLELFEDGRAVGRFEFSKSFESSPPSFASPFIWVSNSGEDTVSKLSTRTGEEHGRYEVGVDPSRTSVDLDGNAFVASRGSGEFTKIKAFGCQGQECIIFVRKTCSGARGVAVDAQNNVWVGGQNEAGKGCLQYFDGETGELKLEHQELSALVYGLAIDRKGVLWGVLRKTNQLLKVARSGRILAQYQVPEPADIYGVAVDVNGRIWLTNHLKGDVLRFDPASEGWDRFDPKAGYHTRGAAADAAGNVWVVSSAGGGALMKIDAETGDFLGQYPAEGASEPVGIAIDGDQFVWVVDKRLNRAIKYDPETGDMVSHHKVGRQPYTYSDMTGYALNNFVSSDGLYRVGYHNIPFRLRITSPTGGATLSSAGVEPVDLAVRLEVFDPLDPLVKVEWFVDGLSVGTETEAPFGLLWKYRALAEGDHTISARGISRSGFTDEDKVSVNAIETFGTVKVAVTREGRRLDSIPRTILVVFDSSGSMWGLVDGQRKVDAAKAAVLDILRSLPQDVQVGLRAYGHRSKRCTDSELIVGVGPPGRPALEKALLGLRPRGRTPIARSIELAAEDLKESPGGYLGERMVLLVTDGIETCKGSPCEVAGKLNTEKSRLRVNVVGFGLEAGVDRTSLECMADATGGIYADADDPRDLAKALGRAVKVNWFLVDEAGRQVKVGSVKSSRLVVPVGRYRVRFGAKDQRLALKSELFEVGTRAQILVTLELQEQGPPVVSVETIPGAPP